MLLLRFVGVLLLRFGGSKFDAVLLKLPPRITRLEDSSFVRCGILSVRAA
jgi:hypothetical protein